MHLCASRHGLFIFGTVDQTPHLGKRFHRVTEHGAHDVCRGFRCDGASGGRRDLAFTLGGGMDTLLQTLMIVREEMRYE